ncbi:enoyl-CoA hydratase/isomerase family protein [Deinococcus roseus]|uniref:Enoyl-CoA hydratase n=1 Tax=Deinococcus roseus TaxID=392414 RepID=A0ABQ2CVF1_9DEIO|nr:enoyl-CoA hydratase-related protein [Deinococcus roseus]GGJ24828.1 enoyl-CoA hydratase [Deinococcus roseus]
MLHIQHNGPIARLTLASPENRNALSPQMVQDLQEAFDQLKTHPTTRVIVLCAEGKVFCSGADLKNLHQLLSASSEDNLHDSRKLAQLFETIYTHPRPIIAAVEGKAIAGGAGLASACDLVVASSEASFAYTEVKLGFVAAIVMVFLLRAVGEKHARELLLTGEAVSAADAYRMGLINRLTEPGQALSRATLLAEHIARNSPVALSSTKSLLASLPSMGLQEALSHAAQMNAWARTTADLKEGIQSFLEKRPPRWQENRDD